MPSNHSQIAKETIDGHQGREITIDELLSSKYNLKMTNNIIKQCSYTVFKKQNYSYRNLLNTGYFDMSFIMFPETLSKSKISQLYLDTVMEGFADKAREETRFSVDERFLREPLKVKRIKKEKRKTRTVPLARDQKATSFMDFSKELGELGVLMDYRRDIVIRPEKIVHQNNTIVHLIYPFGHVFFSPRFDYFTITTKKNCDKRYSSITQAEHTQELCELYKESSDKYIELKQKHISKESIWPAHDSTLLVNKRNVFFNFTEHIKQYIKSDLSYLSSSKYTWITNYHIKTPGYYMISPLFEAVVARCWYVASRLRTKMMKRALTFLISVNSGITGSYSIVTKTGLPMPLSTWDMKKKHIAWHEKKKKSKTAILLKQTGMKLADIERYENIRVYNKPGETVKGIPDGRPGTDYEHLADDMKLFIEGKIDLVWICGTLNFWIIFNHILYEYTDFGSIRRGLPKWTSDEFKDAADVIYKNQTLFNTAIRVISQSFKYRHLDNKYRGSYRVEMSTENSDYAEFRQLLDTTKFFTQHGPYYYVNKDYFDIHGKLFVYN